MAANATERKNFRLHWGKYFRSREVEPYIRSMENQISGTEARISGMEDELMALQETIDVKNRKIEELRQMSEDAEQKLKESGQMREEAIARLEQIEEESQKLMLQKEELHKTRLETNKRLAEAEQRNNQIRQESESALNLRNQCMEALNKMQEQSREAQQAAEAAEARRSQAITDAENAETELAKTQEEVERLKNQSAHVLEDANVQAEVAISEAKEKAARMVAEAQGRAEYLLQEAQRQAAENQSNAGPFKARISELEAEVTRLQNQILDSDGKEGDTEILAQYQARIAQLEVENIRLQESGGGAPAAAPGTDRQAEIQVYQDRIRQLEKELGALRQLGIEQQIGGQDSAIEALKANLEEAQRAYQDMAAQNQTLHMRIDQQEREIAQLENASYGSSLKDANQRARQIIQDALEESGRILDEAEVVRSRAFAATKAAYFNALMFRQKLAEQFTDIEQSLDDSLGILRSTDMVALSPRMNQEYQAETRWAPVGDGRENLQ